MLLTKRDIQLAALASASVLTVSVWSLQFQTPPGLLLSSGVIFLILLITILGCYRGLIRAIRFYSEKEFAVDHKRLEELILLTSAVTPAVPFPPMRGFAISPDFGNILAREIMHRKPRLVVELGSGVSTLISAYCLRRLGAGRIVSLEHDANYARASRESVAAHGLQDLVTVRHAPLVPVPLNGRRWTYYDPACFQDLSNIDLLVVDGPPASVQEMARFPALPLFFEKLSPGAVILVDDASRPDESEMLRLWQERYPQLSIQRIATEKGTALLSFQAA
ncbi:MAG TPA: class I SAM-dependent methyltransferase [Bryobacteraceae bacterium]|nr:class I SAM-dependent methyltransferase [Bryobacteraceae bacterium]HOQ44642.1 class I SAM-dependent methyltransferase [Bryobacteraceae bacterium]HPU71852.1 class I SAM-dependent methyltransferase [Bryobacteraceae bacterium]